MKPMSDEDALAVLSILWKPHGTIKAEIEEMLRARGESTVHAWSRFWQRLQDLKKRGLAEFEYEGPIVRCRRTPQSA